MSYDHHAHEMAAWRARMLGQESAPTGRLRIHWGDMLACLLGLLVLAFVVWLCLEALYFAPKHRKQQNLAVFVCLLERGRVTTGIEGRHAWVYCNGARADTYLYGAR